jgi:tRNA (mo5U34)-methyltransferase
MRLADKVREVDWYHTIELEPGLETEGVYDLRPYVPRYRLPQRMDGMRALDVGTFDGFWAFEMERRGADVTAIDVEDDRYFDWPASRRPQRFERRPQGAGFEIAKAALGSKVERHACSVYDATPERFGTFDIVLCASVLIHLRDQVLALERIAGLCAGTFISVEAYDRVLSLAPFAAARYRALRESSVVFWEPNLRGWRDMIVSAGFDTVEQRDRFDIRARAGWKVRHVAQLAKKGSSATAAQSPRDAEAGVLQQRRP